MTFSGAAFRDYAKELEPRQSMGSSYSVRAHRDYAKELEPRQS